MITIAITDDQDGQLYSQTFDDLDIAATVRALNTKKRGRKVVKKTKVKVHAPKPPVNDKTKTKE